MFNLRSRRFVLQQNLGIQKSLPDDQQAEYGRYIKFCDNYLKLGLPLPPIELMNLIERHNVNNKL